MSESFVMVNVGDHGCEVAVDGQRLALSLEAGYELMHRLAESIAAFEILSPALEPNAPEAGQEDFMRALGQHLGNTARN